MWFFRKDDEGVDVFIGNLPDKTSAYDIEQLLSQYATEVTVNFYKKRFKDGSSINYCVVPFSTRKRGERAMKAMRLSKLGGEYLKVHEYHFRSYHNDRRLNPYSPVHVNDSEGNQRSGDRRRQELLSEQLRL